MCAGIYSEKAKKEAKEVTCVAKAKLITDRRWEFENWKVWTCNFNSSTVAAVGEYYTHTLILPSMCAVIGLNDYFHRVNACVNIHACVYESGNVCVCVCRAHACVRACVCACMCV